MMVLLGGSPGYTGELKTDDTDKTWQPLRTLNNHGNKPWLMAGDFNEILIQCEKEGGEAQPLNPNKRWTVLGVLWRICDLHDLGFLGDPFTCKTAVMTPKNISAGDLTGR